ncbi:MAG: hypothetical protein Q9157_003020 [Trypethelium eluteriae]
MGATISPSKGSLASTAVAIESTASDAVTVYSSSTSSTANSNAGGSVASSIPANNPTSSTAIVTATSLVVAEASTLVDATSTLCDGGSISGMQDHSQYCTAAVTSSFQSTAESSHLSTFPSTPDASKPPIQPVSTVSPMSTSLYQNPSHGNAGPSLVPGSNDPDKGTTGDNSASTIMSAPGKDPESHAASITRGQSEASTRSALLSSASGKTAGGGAVSTTTHEGAGGGLSPVSPTRSEVILPNPTSGVGISSSTGSTGVQAFSASPPPDPGRHSPNPASQDLIVSVSAGGKTAPFSQSLSADQATTSSETEASPPVTSIGGGVAFTNTAMVAGGPVQNLPQSSSTAPPNIGIGGISTQSLAPGPGASSNADAGGATVRPSVDPNIGHGSSSGVPAVVKGGPADNRPSTGSVINPVHSSSPLGITGPAFAHDITSGQNAAFESHTSWSEGSESGAAESGYTAGQTETGEAFKTTSSNQQAMSNAFLGSGDVILTSQTHTPGVQATNLGFPSSISSYESYVIGDPAGVASSSSTDFGTSVVDFVAAGQTSATQLRSTVPGTGNIVSVGYSFTYPNGQATNAGPNAGISSSTSPGPTDLGYDVAGSGPTAATTTKTGTYTMKSVSQPQEQFKSHTSASTTAGPSSSVPSGSNLDTGSSPILLGSIAAILSASSQQVTTFSDSDDSVVIGSTTLSSGELITLSGSSNSFASSEIIVQSSTIVFSTSVNSNLAAPPAQVEAIFTINGHTHTASEVADKSDLVVIDGTTLSPGGRALTIDGDILILAPAGLEVESATNSRVLIPLTSAAFMPASTLSSTNIEVTSHAAPFPTTSAPEPEAVFTVDGHVYIAYAISGQPSEVIINGTTLSMGGAPLTLDGEQVSLDANGGLDFASVAGSGRPIAFSTVVFTMAETTAMGPAEVTAGPELSSSDASGAVGGAGSATTASSTTKSRGGKVKLAVLLSTGCALGIVIMLC